MTLLMPFAFVYLQLRVSIISINYSVIIWAQAFRSTSLKKRITREQKPLLQSSNSTHLNPSSSNCLPSPSFVSQLGRILETETEIGMHPGGLLSSCIYIYTTNAQLNIFKS
ncbi:hypothetical protein V3481_000628 [Fusarium oxysporum f. sp. vasinfectum]